jgi:Tfp pilus assembly protein FimV
MSRSLRLILVASLSLAGLHPAFGQDTPATPADSTTPTTDVAKLREENAELKKEVTDAQITIAKLQGQLAQANAAAKAAQAAEAAQASAPAPADSTSATAPPGPMKALPLDATNAVTTPSAPGAPAATDAAAAGGKTYTVVKGDSLWKIAHKMYPGDTKNGVDKLQEANKDSIGGKPLKIGQVLIVPQ